jgi:hypothetical protein
MDADRQAPELVEIHTGWGPVAFAGGFAVAGAAACTALASRFESPTAVVAAACGGTLAASLGGLVALWFGAELSRRWSNLFALALSWYVILGCLLGELPLGPALAVGMATALGLGSLLVWRLAGFARRARGHSFTGAYLGPLLALVAVLLFIHDGEAGGIALLLVLPLALPFGALVGALLGAER